MKRMHGQGIALLAAFFILAGTALLVGHGIAASPGPGYHMVKKITLGGEGGWDYFTVDPATHRIFIPRQTHMLVLDPDGKVVSDMPNMQGNHAVDFAPELKRGFTGHGG